MRVPMEKPWKGVGSVVLIMALSPLWAGSVEDDRSIAWYDGTETTNGGGCSGCFEMSPLFVALFGTTFLGEASSRRVWIGIGLCVAGAITIGIGDAGEPGETSNALLGDVMALGGALAMAGYMLVGRRFRRRSVARTGERTRET